MHNKENTFSSVIFRTLSQYLSGQELNLQGSAVAAYRPACLEALLPVDGHTFNQTWFYETGLVFVLSIIITVTNAHTYKSEKNFQNKEAYDPTLATSVKVTEKSDSAFFHGNSLTRFPYLQLSCK